MLQIRNLFKNYGQLAVLRGIELTVQTGELVALVGSSGAGKTTLLQIVGTLDTPDEGEVLFEGESLFKLTARQQARFRNTRLGFVFQFHHLLAEFSALENVCMPALIQGIPKRTCQLRATDLLVELGLGQRLHHRPSELSGGEQQRVAVARALINQPSLILADEPTGNLDSHNGHALFELFRNLAANRGVGLLVATHNEAFAASAARTITLKDGQIYADTL